MPHPIFKAARDAWDAASGLRSRRRRYKNYTYGRQWDDIVRTPAGELMTEGEYASISGKEPLTNNLIRQLVKSVVGRFRHNLLSAKAPLGERPEGIDELDARMLEEFLISGCAVQKVSLERGKVTVDNVSPERFFVNRFSDPRGRDIELVGMLHDMGRSEMVMRFSHGSPAKSRAIGEIFNRSANGGDTCPRCRVTEAWALEGRDLLRCHDRRRATTFWVDASAEGKVEAINRRRAERREEAIAGSLVHTLRWHGYFFGPDGELLDETDSPYRHGLHPFAVKFYPLTDGEVHPFVEDIIDQQRYINRLITLIDHIMSFSAKGVLLFPDDQRPEDMTWEDIAMQWCRPNGVIPYNHSMGAEPRQMYSTGGLQGASELLGLEMKLFEQISGVSGALQGQTAPATTGARLYESQVENAAISLLDIFETFNSFRASRDYLVENC